MTISNSNQNIKLIRLKTLFYLRLNIRHNKKNLLNKFVIKTSILRKEIIL